jgi:hypothetical protein
MDMTAEDRGNAFATALAGTCVNWTLEWRAMVSMAMALSSVDRQSSR